MGKSDTSETLTRYRRCNSNIAVVAQLAEHSLGMGKVEDSISSDSTIHSSVVQIAEPSTHNRMGVSASLTITTNIAGIQVIGQSHKLDLRVQVPTRNHNT